jgi:hypothetical protein
VHVVSHATVAGVPSPPAAQQQLPLFVQHAAAVTASQAR